jgi:WD40 repeat protein
MAGSIRPREAAAQNGWDGQVLLMPPDNLLRRRCVVTAVAVDGQGKYLATGGDDHVVRIWNLGDAALVHSLRGHRDWIRDAVFYGNTPTLVTAANDRRILLWDILAGRAKGELPIAEAAVSSLAVSPDAQWIAAAGFDNRLRIYSTETLAASRELVCECPDMRCVAFAPQGSLVAAGGRDGRLHLWRWPDGSELYCGAVHRQRIRSIAFAPSGNQIASGGEDRQVILTNPRTLEQTPLPQLPAKVTAVAYYNQDQLAIAASDNRIYLWNTRTNQPTGTLEGHSGTVTDLASWQSMIVSGSYDTSARVWDVGKNVASLPNRESSAWGSASRK